MDYLALAWWVRQFAQAHAQWNLQIKDTLGNLFVRRMSSLGGSNVWELYREKIFRVLQLCPS